MDATDPPSRGGGVGGVGGWSAETGCSASLEPDSSVDGGGYIERGCCASSGGASPEPVCGGGVSHEPEGGVGGGAYAAPPGSPLETGASVELIPAAGTGPANPASWVVAAAGRSGGPPVTGPQLNNATNNTLRDGSSADPLAAPVPSVTPDGPPNHGRAAAVSPDPALAVAVDMRAQLYEVIDHTFMAATGLQRR